MGYSSAREFFEALSKGSPVFKDVMGERPNLWLYIHGPTHHWAVTAHREAGYLLPAAEMFNTFAALLAGDFSAYPAREFNEAWQAAIYPDHGWGGKEGQVTDRLFRKKYELARDTGRDQLERALTAIAGRIGVSAGEPVAEDNDLFGAAVQLAARACNHAAAGSILASTAVRELCVGKGFAFEPRGPFELKGFDELIPLFEVNWRQ